MRKEELDLILVTRFSSYRVTRSPNGNVATGGRRRVAKGDQELVSSTSTTVVDVDILIFKSPSQALMHFWGTESARYGARSTSHSRRREIVFVTHFSCLRTCVLEEEELQMFLCLHHSRDETIATGISKPIICHRLPRRRPCSPRRWRPEDYSRSAVI